MKTIYTLRVRVRRAWVMVQGTRCRVRQTGTKAAAFTVEAGLWPRGSDLHGFRRVSFKRIADLDY